MNISQLPLFLRKPLITIQTVSMQFLLNRSLILAMATLQLLWLVVIAVTGASTKYDTILVVAIFSVLATLIVIWLPTSTIQKLSELKTWLMLNEKRTLLFLCLAGLLIGVLYAYSQHEWGDERTSLKAANIIATEGVPAAYEKVGWLGQQHPPLFSIIFALTLKLPGPELFYMRFVSVLFLIGTMLVTFHLGRELYSREVGYLAAILLLSFPLLVRLSASAMMDIQLTFFFSLALLLFLRLSKTPSYKLAFATGIVIGLGLLTKYIMILIFVILFFYILFFKSFRTIKSYLFVVTAVSMSVFAIWLLYASQMGILAGQFQKILNFVGSYHVVRNLGESTQDTPPVQPAVVEEVEEESANPQDEMQNGIFRLGLETLFTRLPSSLGLYHAPLIFFGLLYLLKRHNFDDLVLLLWIGGVSLALLLTLPDHRYFLPIFPALALAIAHVLLRFPKYAERAFLLSLLFGVGNLYMFANWTRESHLFLLTP
jgi:4-amino-4-deoxy-L-arabinose transferase-like glycosyltransferase